MFQGPFFEHSCEVLDQRNVHTFGICQNLSPLFGE